MKYCSKCGKQYSDSVKFCATCGTPVSKDEKSGKITINQGGSPKQPTSEGDAQSLALATYAEEYAAFKKKWFIGIIVACVLYFAPGIIFYLAYLWYFRPKFEQELVERYKKENHIS
jgi:uncharacterized membrane protein YvbJ